MRLGGGRARAHEQTYRLCSLLLCYPDQELLAARAELVAASAAAAPPASVRALGEFCDWWQAAEPLALQQHYVETFDLDKHCGLYLSFYGEGERRERGLSLLRLKRLYRAAGLPLEGTELPDYLPVMLEFAAAAPGGRGVIVLREHRPALELLRESLHGRGTPYAHVLDAVCLTLGSLSAADRAKALALGTSGPPTERVGLEPVTPPEIMPAGTASR